MKRIVKGLEPENVVRWRKENERSAQNITYQNMPKDELRLSLLAEQGHLCAYTMLRIETVANGHIEHIVSREQSRELATVYENLVYCFPGENPTSCPYGAGKKDNTQITRDTFVSPLDVDCEERFFYARNGAVNGVDDAAEKTVLTLNLNHNILIRARKAAVAKLPINKTKRPFDKGEALQLAQEFLNRDHDGKYPEFAVALFQAMRRYAMQRSDR